DTVHRIEEGDYRRVTNHREIHNVLGMENVRATYDGLLKLQPNQRPFVLTRAAFAGTQRYAATWTGDNQATWLHYRLSLPTLLGLSVSGYPLSGNDVGGFDGSPTADLTTRWMELGTFMPVFRNHSAVGTLDKEPWVHGETHEAIRRRYIEERYKLLPYIYTSMEETSRTGVPLMRPMFVDYASDQKVALSDKMFLFGNDLLVAPKLDEKLDAYKITLPKGTWYNYWTGERVEGGKEFSLNPPLDTLPVYVRAGAIIPRQQIVQNTDEKPKGSLELHVYPGPNCTGSVYADDGNTFDYKKGQYFRQQFTCELTTNGLRVSLAKPEGQYNSWWPGIDLIISNDERWKGSPNIQVTTSGASAPATSSQRANGDLVVHVEAAAQPEQVDVSF
ncbi:MAG TPA: TIM-barrel domain-containing protein, partial [Terriglobales bacterium]